MRTILILTEEENKRICAAAAAAGVTMARLTEVFAQATVDMRNAQTQFQDLAKEFVKLEREVKAPPHIVDWVSKKQQKRARQRKLKRS